MMVPGIFRSLLGMRGPDPEHVKAFRDATQRIDKEMARRPDPVGDVINGLRRTSFKRPQKKQAAAK